MYTLIYIFKVEEIYILYLYPYSYSSWHVKRTTPAEYEDQQSATVFSLWNVRSEKCPTAPLSSKTVPFVN